MRRNNKEVIFVEVDERFKPLVRLAAKIHQGKADDKASISDFTKAALKEKMSRLASYHPELKEAMDAAA